MDSVTIVVLYYQPLAQTTPVKNVFIEQRSDKQTCPSVESALTHQPATAQETAELLTFDLYL